MVHRIIVPIISVISRPLEGNEGCRGEGKDAVYAAKGGSYVVLKNKGVYMLEAVWRTRCCKCQFRTQVLRPLRRQRGWGGVSSSSLGEGSASSPENFLCV